MSSVVTNLVLGVFLFLFISNGVMIFRSLHVKDEEAIVGKFKYFGEYEKMPDLDNRSRQVQNKF